MFWGAVVPPPSPGWVVGFQQAGKLLLQVACNSAKKQVCHSGTGSGDLANKTLACVCCWGKNTELSAC